MSGLLEVTDLVVGYSHLVLREVSFEVSAGELTVLTGLNGAGKTTTVSTVAGLLAPWSGTIRFDGDQVGGLPASDLVRRGIALVPEGRRVFPRMSVDDHLRLGAWVRRGDDALVASARDRSLAAFPRLGERLDQAAGTLSGGEQQMLAIARALMSTPRLLLVDEASLGLSPTLASSMFEVLAGLAIDGMSVVVVEQQVGVLALADRVVVLEKGAVAYTGTGEEARATDLRSRFLGAA